MLIVIDSLHYTIHYESLEILIKKSAGLCTFHLKGSELAQIAIAR